MSHRAKKVAGTHNSARWTAVVEYNDGKPNKSFAIEEIEDLDELIELGPDWGTIEEIRIRRTQKN